MFNVLAGAGSGVLSAAGQAGAGMASGSGMSLAGAGQLLGGAGGFMSSLGIGGSSPKSAARESRQLFDYQRQQTIADEEYRTARLVRAAKKAGLHPLYALGIQPFNSPSVSVGGLSSSRDHGAALSALGGAMGNYAMQKHSRIMDAQNIRESESRVNANNASATRDFAAAQAQASLAHRTVGRMNSQQDTGIVSMPKTRYKTSSVGTVDLGPGLHGQAAEDALGGVIGELNNVVEFAKGVGREYHKNTGDLLDIYSRRASRWWKQNRREHRRRSQYRPQHLRR